MDIFKFNKQNQLISYLRNIPFRLMSRCEQSTQKSQLSQSLTYEWQERPLTSDKYSLRLESTGVSTHNAHRWEPRAAAV